VTNNNPLTTTDILAAASEILGSSGYSRVAQSLGQDVWGANGRLFEDPYGVVALVVYETWSDLSDRWLDAQTVLIEAISKSLTSSEPKAWEGYLVLLTPAVLPTEVRADADRIRYDTARARKLVATGEDLKTVADVQRVLTPLLPLSDIDLGSQEATLSMLPEILSAKGLPSGAVQVTVKAFSEQQPLLERLHTYRTSNAARSD
jgi:hypothetical protein